MGKPDWGGTAAATGSTGLLNIGATAVAQNATSTKTAMISRPGYILQIELINATSSAVSMPVSVVVSWTDSATGTVIDRQDYQILAGSVASPHFVGGRGPTSGDSVSISVTNHCASADNLSYQLFLSEVTHSFAGHDWRTDDQFVFAPAGWTTSDDDMVSGVLIGNKGVSIGAGLSDTFILPFYAGPVFAMFTTGSGTTDLAVQLIAEADAGLPGPWPVWGGQSDAKGNLTAQAWLPRVQCAVKATNGNAGPQTVTLSVVVAPRPG
jgi:hypothetical protein